MQALIAFVYAGHSDWDTPNYAKDDRCLQTACTDAAGVLTKPFPALLKFAGGIAEPVDEAAKPGVSNLLRIYSAIDGRTVPELEAAYGGKGYGDLKKDLAEVVGDTFGAFKERTEAILADQDKLDLVLAEGARQAGAVASATLAAVYDRIGFLPAAARGTAS